jgi:hypothetical protein
MSRCNMTFQVATKYDDAIEIIFNLPSGPSVEGPQLSLPSAEPINYWRCNGWSLILTHANLVFVPVFKLELILHVFKLKFLLFIIIESVYVTMSMIKTKFGWTGFEDGRFTVLLDSLHILRPLDSVSMVRLLLVFQSVLILWCLAELVLLVLVRQLSGLVALMRL